MAKFTFRARLLKDRSAVRIWSINFQGWVQEVSPELWPDWFKKFRAENPYAQIELISPDGRSRFVGPSAAVSPNLY